MSEKFKLDLIKKEIDKSEKETRWFVETNDGFDGTAQGYGYKTPQAVYRAYAYFKGKDKRDAEKNMIKKFFKENPDVKKAFNNYMSLEIDYDYMDDFSIENMLEYIGEDIPDVSKKLLDNKHLWKALMKYEY